MIFLQVSLLACLLAASSAFLQYQNLIPNGHNVRNPCDRSSWAGAGHESSTGAGPRNPFGADFALFGHSWNDALCRYDSDGDGLTNGEELGDPICHWTETNNAHIDAPRGHPGICEPVGAPRCGHSWFACA